LHYHTRAVQLFYVIEGQLEIELVGEKVTLASGDSLEIAPILHHRVANTSKVDAHFLVISSPSTTDDRVNLTR